MKKFLTKTLALVAMLMLSVSSWAGSIQYCGEEITSDAGNALFSCYHVSGSTYAVKLEAQGTLRFASAVNVNLGVNQTNGAGIFLGNATWNFSSDGVYAISEFNTASEESIPTGFYGNYICFGKQGGGIVEFKDFSPSDIDWTATCPEYKDYTITVYTTNGAPYVHAYNAAGWVYKAWDDDEMMNTTAYANTYIYTITEAPADGIKVIFRNHEKDQQAADVDVTEDAYFNVYYDSEHEWAYTATPTTAHNMIDLTIKVQAETTPKIRYWGVADAPAWDDDPEMTLVAGYTDWFEYTISNIDENNGVNYIIRLGDEQSADQSTLVNVCKAASINSEAESNKVTLVDADCPGQLVPEDPHPSNKGFGTYQKSGIALYDWNGDFAGENACGSISLYVVTVGNAIYYKAVAENGGTFENGTDYFCQLRTWKEDNTEMREHWAREMSNDKTTRWTALGGANNPDLAPYGDVMHLTSYMVMTGCGARTFQTINYQRDYINNPIIDAVAPTLTSANVVRNISTYTINVAASADDEIFYLFKDVTDNNKVYVSLNNSVEISTDGSGVAHTVECYAVDYNGNMSAKQEVVLPMESIQVPAAPAPTHAAANVLSLYSDAEGYTAIINGGSRCDWNGAISVKEIETATNDHAYLYTLTNSEGSNWFGWTYGVKDGYKAEGMTGIDASQMHALHLDIWSATNGAISVYPIYGGGATTKDQAFYRFNLTAGEWTSVDITYDMLQNKPAEGYDWSSIFQLKFAGCSATGVIAIDNVYFWKEVTPVEVTLSNVTEAEYGFATYCAATNFTVDGADVYKATLSNTTLTLNKVTGVVPANAGVILVGEPNATATILATSETATADMTGNSLLGTAVEASRTSLQGDHDYLMVLNKNTNGFVSYTGDNMPANKAYILYDNAAAASSIRLVFAETNVATGVENAVDATKAAKMLINGQLYIVRDGKLYDTTGRLAE